MNDKNTKKKYTIMSGGTFDYSQRTIELIADDIEQTILEVVPTIGRQWIS